MVRRSPTPAAAVAVVRPNALRPVALGLRPVGRSLVEVLRQPSTSVLDFTESADSPRLSPCSPPGRRGRRSYNLARAAGNTPGRPLDTLTSLGPHPNRRLRRPGAVAPRRSAPPLRWIPPSSRRQTGWEPQFAIAQTLATGSSTGATRRGPRALIPCGAGTWVVGDDLLDCARTRNRPGGRSRKRTRIAGGCPQSAARMSPPLVANRRLDAFRFPPATHATPRRSSSVWPDRQARQYWPLSGPQLPEHKNTTSIAKLRDAHRPGTPAVSMPTRPPRHRECRRASGHLSEPGLGTFPAGRFENPVTTPLRSTTVVPCCFRVRPPACADRSSSGCNPRHPGNPPQGPGCSTAPARPGRDVTTGGRRRSSRPTGPRCALVLDQSLFPILAPPGASPVPKRRCRSSPPLSLLRVLNVAERPLSPVTLRWSALPGARGC